ncbi:MAG TPA: HEAT repeat domain-containing protein [Verrucomicrobiae bacterium]
MKYIARILLAVTLTGTGVSRAQTTSTNAESAARIAIAAAAGVSRELAAATPSNNPASPALSEAFTSPDARQRFLAVEQFARLPEAEQAERLPDFYTQLPTRSLSMWIEGILSSSPHNILDRYQKGDAYDGNTGRWALQLADAAPAMTAEQVADNLKDRMWLDIAARARALWVLKQHPNITSNLIAADLELRNTNAVQRATATILALELKTFTPRLLTIWMANDELSESVWATLLFLRDPALVKPLLERVKQDPKFLIRCAGLFQGTFYDQPADPVLLKLLDSPDPEIRYQAAYALEECRDSRLAEPAVRLAGDTNSEPRFVAAHIVARLPEASFKEVRSGLLPLLSDKDEHVRYYALLSFGQRKDLAAGPVILEALRRDQFAEQYKVWVMQAMSALSGNTWNYYSHEWGPARPGNQTAIAQFEAWLKKRQAAAKAGE